MQVTRLPGPPPPKTFKPFVLEVRVESLEEAVALRALHYGMSNSALDEIVQGASMRPPEFQQLLKVTQLIGIAAGAELTEQGV